MRAKNKSIAQGGCAISTARMSPTTCVGGGTCLFIARTHAVLRGVRTLEIDHGHPGISSSQPAVLGLSQAVTGRRRPAAGLRKGLGRRRSHACTAADHRDTSSRELGTKKGRCDQPPNHAPAVTRRLNETRRCRATESSQIRLATGAGFPTILVIGRWPSTVDENRDRRGGRSPRTNGFT